MGSRNHCTDEALFYARAGVQRKSQARAKYRLRLCQPLYKAGVGCLFMVTNATTCLSETSRTPRNMWAFLECDGSAEWTHFRERLQGRRDANFPEDFSLAAEADELLTGSVGARVDPMRFAMALQDPRAPREESDCVYGVVAALFVRAQHLLATGDAVAAQSDLHLALQFLGRELGLDFLESTSWNLRSADILLANPSENALLGERSASTVVRAELVSLLPPATRVAPPRDGNHDSASPWPLQGPRAVDPHCVRWPCGRPVQFTPSKNRQTDHSSLHVMVYGYHPVLIEPIATMALGGYSYTASHINLFWYGVSERDCMFFAPLCRGETRRTPRIPIPGKWRFKSYDTDADVAEVAHRYRNLWDAEVAAGLKVDLVLCMELRDAYFLWTVARLPTIYYPAIIFLQDEAFTEFGAAEYLRQFDEMRRHDVLTSQPAIVAGGSSSSVRVPAAIIAQSPYLAENVFYHTARRIPAVRPLALYVGVRYSPNSTAEYVGGRDEGLRPDTIRALVLCARTRLLMSHPCRFLFREGLKLLPRRTRLRMQLPTGDGDVVHGLSFEEVTRFNAVVLFPWNIAITTFVEMYAMHMPLFVPDALWLARLWPKAMTTYQRGHSDLHRKLRSRAQPQFPNSSAVRSTEAQRRRNDALREHPSPYPSLDRLVQDFPTMHYWSTYYAHIHSLPGVRAFSSIPALLQLIQQDEEQLVLMSQAMAQEAARARHEVVPFWEGVVGRLLSAG